MKYIKHQFPVRRSNTITRSNVEVAMALDPSLDTSEKVADHFCGVGTGGAKFAKVRHVARARMLMQPRRRQ